MPYVLKTTSDSHPLKVALQLLQFKNDELARYREFQLPIPFIKKVEEPEPYDLDKIKIPIELYYAADDTYSKAEVSIHLAVKSSLLYRYLNLY